mgnify:CR=1 FL=1
MPPIIAILLALLTKEVYLSLFAGCALGALLVAEFHPWVAFDTLFNTMIDSVDFSILMFMILLGDGRYAHAGVRRHPRLW